MSIKLYAVAFVLLILLDLVWIGGFMTQFYKDNLKDFLRFSPEGNLMPRLIPTALVYIAGAVMLVVFVLPQVRNLVQAGESISVASLYGALLGLLVYMFYDFTNFALFDKWNLVVTLVDVAWGTVLFYITTLVLILI